MDDIEALLEAKPQASAGFAVTEMRYGRLAWLAEHIRRCNFQISPVVAKMLLAMLEGTDPTCFFELRAVRRSGLPPASTDPQLRMFRAVDMAVAVARRCKFKRGLLKKACFEVGTEYGLKAEHVQREIRPLRQVALDIVLEEEMQAAYDRGELDFLGRPKNPSTPFEGKTIDL